MELDVGPNNLQSPNTRELVLDGLRQALQGRIAQVWANVTLAGEPDPGPRFIEGFNTAVKAYEKAWHYIDSKLKPET